MMFTGSSAGRAVWPIVILIVVGLLLPARATARTRQGSPEGREKQVRDFVAAFNSRDIDAMLRAVDDGIQWLNVDGSKVTIEVEGKKALRESMERYFQSCPTCRSSLLWVENTTARVTAMERASWTAKSGARSQASLSVYEFRDGKIYRVYYFPAEV